MHVRVGHADHRRSVRADAHRPPRSLPAPSMMRAVSFAIALAIVGVALPANAAFHLVFVSEVYAGDQTTPTSQYVELAMYAAGQNFLGGHEVEIYDAAGALLHTYVFAG